MNFEVQVSGITTK